MKKNSLILLALSAIALVGCASGAGKATAEDKANLQNLVDNGIGTAPPGAATQQAAPPPVNGEVEQP